MKARAITRLSFSSEKQLKVVLDALKPETQTPSTRRSKVQMKGEGNSLTLDFRARDTSALRAAINSYLRQIGMVINVLNLIEEPTCTHKKS
jgi:tRNA threonylcarbamoyladenosine modification (KEOPS) complex  Pcc1 subunit